MPRPAEYQDVNLHRSVLYRMGETITVGGTPYPILHEIAWRDPEERRRPAVDPDVAWVETAWIERRAGRGGFSVLVCQVYSRVGGKGDLDRDETGSRCAQIADEIRSLWIGRDAAMPGGKRWNVDVVDIVNGTLATLGTHMMCQNSSGYWGVPESDESLGIVNEMWQQRLTYWWRMPRDTGHAAAYYTE